MVEASTQKAATYSAVPEIILVYESMIKAKGANKDIAKALIIKIFPLKLLLSTEELILLP